MGDARFAAYVPVEIAGRRGTLTPFSADADIPTPLRNGARESLAGKFDFGRNCLHPEKMGVGVPLKVNVAGHDVLRAVSSDVEGAHRWGSGATQSVS